MSIPLRLHRLAPIGPSEKVISLPMLLGVNCSSNENTCLFLPQIAPIPRNAALFAFLLGVAFLPVGTATSPGAKQISQEAVDLLSRC